jgi:mannose-6-phosphate isomerase-like protein (cupin superfamily)
MTNPKNAVHLEYQTPGAEGYIFEGMDGSQVIIWQGPNHPMESDYHTHDFDEYFIVVEGTFKGDIGGTMVTVKKGEECVIPAGTPHNGRYTPGFRSIHAFSKKRAERAL